MEIIRVSEIKDLLERAHKSLSIALHVLETKILVGEINRPEIFKAKRVYKKKIKTEVKVSVPFNPDVNLPEDQNTFYSKPKRIRRKKEVIDDHSQTDVQG